MSNKKRKIKGNQQRPIKHRRVISSQQNMRLQQAVRAHSAGNLALAEAEYRALIAEKIRTPDLYCKLASVCARTGRRSEAISLWKQALGIDPRSVEARMNLAESYQQAGDVDRSIKLYRRVIAENKELFVARYLLANVLKSKGQFSEASDYYRDVMAEQPEYTQAHFSYSGIHRYRDENDPHISQMLELFQNGKLKEENRIHLSFALAKAYENIGEYAQAFQYLQTGNDLRKKQFAYDIQSDRGLLQSIINSFTRRAISSVPVTPEASNRPIFILGMPRSGTTLVEKILSSHADVHGAGELDYIFALGTQLFLKRSHFQFATLSSYPDTSFALFGKTYLEKIALLNSTKAHITDKMPFNMMMIGLIRMMLPNAKIIHCVRDARDTCLSIYKQNFTTGNYRFAYDLKTIGQFYREYEKLMRHWHEVMPGDIYDISYEALTQNPEDEIRKLVAACELDWQDNCLNFSQSEAVVKTASAFQARQPMYTSSVALWEKYQPFLQPLLDELERPDQAE